MANLLTEKAKYEDTPFTRKEISEIFQTITDITKFINDENPHEDNRIRYNEWTVGISNDCGKRSSAHGSPKIWKDWKCSSDKVAREAERFFNEYKKSKGDGGGGNDDCVYIYCFKNTK